jgi:multicomponent Na+:H+ antiporter subunit E
MGFISFLVLGLWLILAEGSIASLLFAAPVLALALGARLVMPTPIALNRLRPFTLLAFLPYFISRSVLGGLDVTWRALRPGTHIDPAMYNYPTFLRADGARVFMALVASLMPGTLACQAGESSLQMHVISGTREEFIREMQRLEAWTARLFGESPGGKEVRHG